MVLPLQFLSSRDIDPCGFEHLTQVFTKLAHDAIPSIVKIAVLKSGGFSSDTFKNQVFYGSGFLVSKEGYIITCGHVIENATKISVYFKNQEVEALLIQLNSEIDIAVLKIDGTNFPFLTLGDSDVTNIGEWVVSIGYPFSLRPFVASGIVGAKDELGTALFLDILICQGNSGGPLLNLKGEVIGISSALFQSHQELRGVGVAIPINQIKNHVLWLLSGDS